MTKQEKYTIYTDGSCFGNPGKGGLAYVVYKEGDSVPIYTYTQGFLKTTNNRMEMRAVIEALKKFGGEGDITIWSDSKYVVQGVSDWLEGWKKNDWKRREGNRLRSIKNLDLWKQLDELNNENIKWHWVKGHANDLGNDTADCLAVEASKRGPYINDNYA